MSEGFQTFHHNGRTYKVSRLTQEKKDQFSDISKAKAIAAVVASKKYLPAEEYQETLNEVIDAAPHRFAFHSPFTEKALKTHGGVMQLACVLFGCDEAEMVTLFQERRDDVRAVLDLILKESVAQNPTKA